MPPAWLILTIQAKDEGVKRTEHMQPYNCYDPAGTCILSSSKKA